MKNGKTNGARRKERDLSHHESTLGPTSTDEDAGAHRTRTTHSRPSMTFLVGFRYTTSACCTYPSAVTKLRKMLFIRGEEEVKSYSDRISPNLYVSKSVFRVRSPSDNICK
jgi:hypothetical protein